MARTALRLRHKQNLGVDLLVTALAHLHVRNPARRTANDKIFSDGCYIFFSAVPEGRLAVSHALIQNL
jgi:hypothetical protein